MYFDGHHSFLLVYVHVYVNSTISPPTAYTYQPIVQFIHAHTQPHTNMFTVDDQVEFHAEKNYNSSIAAQQIFSSNSEGEVGNKLTQMSNLLGNIETVLKHRVRENYHQFLQANAEIHRVGLEMSDLQRLVDSTRTIIEEIRACRERSMKQPNNNNENILSRTLMRSALNDSKSSMNSNVASSSIPPWLIDAPHELAANVIEHEYDKAVERVLHTRKYIEQEKKSAKGATHSELKDEIYEKIEKRASHLAIELQRSLLDISCSSLWGRDEVKHRLTLLITMGEYSLAAEGFFRSQNGVLKSVLNGTTRSGDIATYVSDVTMFFFESIVDTCQSFLSLFHTYKDDASILALLLKWAYGQLSSFASIVSKQILLGKSEHSSRFISIVKSLARTANGSNHHHNYSSGKCKSPLSFAAKCFNIAYTEACNADALDLHSGQNFCVMTLVEIEKLLNLFIDDLVHEMALQLRSESWQCLDTQVQNVEEYKCMSYRWVHAAFDMFLSELLILLNNSDQHQEEEEQGEDSDVTNTIGYCRDNICDIEAVSVASIMRLLVSYIIEIESVDTTALLSDQMKCYRTTVAAIRNELLPHVEESISSNFYVDAAVFEENSVAGVIDMLRNRLQYLT